MTDPDREHFVRQLRDLERSRGRWRLAALVLAAVLALPVVLGGLLGVAFLPLRERERERVLLELEVEQSRALEAEMRAKAAAVEATRLKDQAEAARQEAGKAKGTGKH
jgi:hypothetical protein